MNQNEPKPSRNRDLDIPPRKGESIESPIPDRGKGEATETFLSPRKRPMKATRGISSRNRDVRLIP
jgi:hypothetical protein